MLACAFAAAAAVAREQVQNPNLKLLESGI